MVYMFNTETYMCPINPIFSCDVLYFLALCPIKVCQCSVMPALVLHPQCLLYNLLVYLVTYLLAPFATTNTEDLPK